MRIRMQFCKGEELRFVSHLDLLKAFERAMRRANIPLAFSEGFNPHPRISFAAAVAVGVTSDSEYMDIETTEDLDAAQLKNTLNGVLPSGLVITDARPVDVGLPPLMAVVNRAGYRVRAKLTKPVTPKDLDNAMAKMARQSQIVVSRATKKGLREKDIKPGILSLSGEIEAGLLVLNMLLSSGGELNVRPEEVVGALMNIGGLAGGIEYLEIHKYGQYIARGSELHAPLEGAVGSTAGR